MTDPKTIAAELSEALAVEEAVIAALTQAYHRGELPYMHFSPAYDVSTARASALSFAIAHLEEERD